MCKQLIAILLLTTLSCTKTYYKKNIKFSNLFLQGKYKEAEKVLTKNKRTPKGKSKLLYYLNRGVVSHFMKDYEKSNNFFEKAYTLSEDFQTNYIENTFSFIINPSIQEYKGEDHELLLLHYYKTLNFLHLKNLEKALVECRRLQIKLNQLQDKYKEENKYKRDAFVHNLIGLIYQAQHEYNNAFIAYRNAINIYEKDYKKLFGIQVPNQLKKDIIYTAHMTGMYDEVEKYKNKFNIKQTPKYNNEEGDIICLWHNGLGPIKTEWGITFAIVRGAGGIVNFQNDELGLAFPFPMPTASQGNLSDLEFIKVAFPKYLERCPIYNNASIHAYNKKYPFEIIEDINKISFKILDQRMNWELSKSLIRVATKKITEYTIRKHNGILGALVGGVNFLSEKADTRNWQLIPHSIYYTRLKLPLGTHQVKFEARNVTGNIGKSKLVKVESSKKITNFYVFNSMSFIEL